MLKVKTGVTPKNLVIAAAAANAAEGLDIYITSGTDGTHMKGSKHYKGDALDLRISNLPPASIQPFMSRLIKRLGDDYDVIREVDHIHVEYDPDVA